MVSKGTHIIIKLVEELEDNSWEAKIVKQNGNRIKLSVNSHHKAVIGQYKLTVMVKCPKQELAVTHDPSKDVVMLFNPWCEGKDEWSVMRQQKVEKRREEVDRETKVAL